MGRRGAAVPGRGGGRGPFPLGIVAIIKASKVTSTYAIGDYAGAQKASQDAKRWTVLTAIIGGGLALLMTIVYVIIFAAALSEASY